MAACQFCDWEGKSLAAHFGQNPVCKARDAASDKPPTPERVDTVEGEADLFESELRDVVFKDVAGMYTGSTWCPIRR